MTTVFVCEDSLDGILTGVYEAWDSHLGHRNVRLKTEAEDNLELFCSYRQVDTDLAKAEKVLRTVERRLGPGAREAICYGAAAEDSGKADAIYRMIVIGLHLKNGRDVINCIQNQEISLVMRLRQRTFHEVHHFLGFLRFTELENGLLYACIEPSCAVLPLLAPHFADRYCQEDWVIHDLTRRQLALHRKGRPWFLMEEEGLDRDFLSRFSREEERLQKLWRTFCTSVTIKERENPKCQRNLLPLRFRPCMTEFQQEK